MSVVFDKKEKTLKNTSSTSSHDLAITDTELTKPDSRNIKNNTSTRDRPAIFIDDLKDQKQDNQN